MFYNNIFTWHYLHLNYFCFPHIFLQLKSQFIHKYKNYSQILSFFFFFFGSSKNVCGKFFVLPILVKAEVKQACFLTVCAQAV